MKQKRIFLIVSFFLVISFIFGLVIFNEDKLFVDKNKSNYGNAQNKKEDSGKEISVNKPEVKCENNWKKYENDVLGLGFCYPDVWEDVVIEPIENLTLLEEALNDYSKGDNYYNNSLFIKFKKGGVEMRIFNKDYKGEHYPNSRAYGKGYLDNIDELKNSRNVCDYKINFTELWEEQGRMTEFWNQCENGIKTRIINHEQYFDKALYSYDLESLAYLNLQNGFFDNVLVKKNYLHISQIEKKISDFTQIFEAKNYPSAVDNSRTISQDGYEKEKEEFNFFINSIYKYAPIVIEKKDFQQIEGEDEKITRARRYYWLLENHKFEEAYQMLSRINTPLDEFKSLYKKVYLAVARDFEKINDNTYKFFLDYQKHNNPKTLYRITVRIINDKIEIIKTEEITSEIVEFDKFKAYAKKENGKSFVILEQYGVETVVDEGVAEYNQDHSNLIDVKFYGDIKFSDSGKYLIYRMGGWEWSKNYIYDIENMEKILEFDSGQNGFSKDEGSFFVCTGTGMSSVAEGTIYGVPDFKKKFGLFNSTNVDTMNVECKYDANKDELTFIYDKDCEEDKEKCKKYEVVYSFEEDKAVSIRDLSE